MGHDGGMRPTGVTTRLSRAPLWLVGIAASLFAVGIYAVAATASTEPSANLPGVVSVGGTPSAEGSATTTPVTSGPGGARGTTPGSNQATPTSKAPTKSSGSVPTTAPHLSAPSTTQPNTQLVTPNKPVVSEGEDGSTQVIVPPTTVPDDDHQGGSDHGGNEHHSTPGSSQHAEH